jgi:hypothetical protein
MHAWWLVLMGSQALAAARSAQRTHCRNIIVDIAMLDARRKDGRVAVMVRSTERAPLVFRDAILGISISNNSHSQ